MQCSNTLQCHHQNGGVFKEFKRRDLTDIDTFVSRESEVGKYLHTLAALTRMLQSASLADQLDLEGRCMRRPVDRRSFRRTGVCPTPGSVQGRDCAW